MRQSDGLLGTALLGITLSLPLGVAAEEGQALETFVCESHGGRQHECRYQATGTVTVHVQRQLSKSRCVFNRNWGTFDGGVWVDQGCRAEFVVRRPPGGHAHAGGPTKTLTCESHRHDRVHCPVSGIDARSVRIERQRSSSACTRGVSWGVSEGENSPPGIWVDKGCRATFAYSTRDWHGNEGRPTYPGAGATIDHGGRIRNNCAAAVARRVGVSPNDVVVTRSTFSGGTGLRVVYVGVPYGRADWVCEVERSGRVANVFYSGD